MSDAAVRRREWTHRHEIWTKITVQAGCIVVPIVAVVFLMSVSTDRVLGTWHITVATIVVLANIATQAYFKLRRKSLLALLFATDIGLTSIIGVIAVSAILEPLRSDVHSWVTERFLWVFILLIAASGALPLLFTHRWKLKEQKILALFQKRRAPAYEVMETLFFYSGKPFWWRPGFYAGSSLMMIGIFALAKELGVQDVKEIQAYVALLLISAGFPFLLSSIAIKWIHYYPLFRRHGDVTVMGEEGGTTVSE